MRPGICRSHHEIHTVFASVKTQSKKPRFTSIYRTEPNFASQVIGRPKENLNTTETNPNTQNSPITVCILLRISFSEFFESVFLERKPRFPFFQKLRSLSPRLLKLSSIFRLKFHKMTGITLFSLTFLNHLCLAAQKPSKRMEAFSVCYCMKARRQGFSISKLLRVYF